jgi:hypothetical protein
MDDINWTSKSIICVLTRSETFLLADVCFQQLDRTGQITPYA